MPGGLAVRSTQSFLISRIPDEELRANLRETMGQLFKFLEADLERKRPAAGGAVSSM